MATRNWLLYSLDNLGTFLYLRGEYGNGLPYLERALAMREKLYPPSQFPNGHAELAQSLNSLGSLLCKRGEYRKAQAYCEQLLVMRRKLYPADRYPDGHPDLAASFNNLGNVLAQLWENDKALPYLEQSVAMHERLYPPSRYPEGHPDLAQSLSNLGVLLQRQGQLAKAQAYTERALAMNEKLYPASRYPEGHLQVAQSLNNLGTLLVSQGESSKAQPYLERALAMSEKLYPAGHYPEGHPELVLRLSNLSSVLTIRGEYRKALPYCEQALAMSQRLGATLVRSGTEVEALNFIGSLPLIRDQYVSITRHLPESAASAYALVWQSKAALTRVLERRQWALRTEQQLPQARQRWRQLSDLRHKRAELLLAQEPADATERNSRLDELNKEIDALDRELLPLLPAVKRSEDLAHSTPDNLRKALRPGHVFIDLLRYVHFEDDRDRPGKPGERRTVCYVAFILRSDSVRRAELGPAEAIEKAVTAWREALTGGRAGRSPAALREIEDRASRQAQALRQLVWQPLARELPQDTHVVYLSPDGALTQMPWTALPGSKPRTVLLEDYALGVVPHGPFLLDCVTPTDSRRSTEKVLLTLGDIRYDDRPADPQPLARRGPANMPAIGKLWPELPGTAREVRQVSKLAGKEWQIRTLGSQVGATALLHELPRARVAHLATHGFFADKQFRSALQLDEKLFEQRLFLTGEIAERIGEGARSPLLLSGLVLAGANRRDIPGRGIVTAESIVGLDLSGLELAVLSACETGLGEVAGGEGVFGLQRAFHLAGARDVVASLWKVDDEATAALMGLFYRGLWEDKLSPREALRRAQLEIYRHPDLVLGWSRGERAPDPAKTVPGPVAEGLSNGRPPALASGTTPAYRWAAFVLSGPGQ
jgi:CHAT domain-containing protein/tetratricopeptide (TPR) repeat protein